MACPCGAVLVRVGVEMMLAGFVILVCGLAAPATAWFVEHGDWEQRCWPPELHLGHRHECDVTLPS
jgi:hypothetical protein